MGYGFIFKNIYEILELIYSLIINSSLEECDIINKECVEEMKKDRNLYIEKQIIGRKNIHMNLIRFVSI